MPVNIAPTIPSEKIEDLLDILESAQFSGGNWPNYLFGPSCGRLRTSLKASGYLSASQRWWAQWWAQIGLLGRCASRGAGESPLRRQGWEHDPRRCGRTQRRDARRRPLPMGDDNSPRVATRLNATSFAATARRPATSGTLHANEHHSAWQRSPRVDADCLIALTFATAAITFAGIEGWTVGATPSRCWLALLCHWRLMLASERHIQEQRA
jgi:hypothetical protein